MSRDNQPLYVSKSTRGDFAHAILIGIWFITGVVTVIHEVTK